MEACRGKHPVSGGCRGDGMTMSWATGMSWKHVVEDTLFRGGCRGDCVSMSWETGMSWKHVVEDTQFRGDVVGTG